jgi:hypothetical protein
MTFEEGNFYTLNGVVDIARCQSKRIKLLEQRIIDLQGHDDLSYIDKKLSEQEEVECDQGKEAKNEVILHRKNSSWTQTLVDNDLSYHTLERETTRP